MPIKVVLPAEQTAAQTKSELERRDINPKSLENMFQKGSGRRRRGVKRKSRGYSSNRTQRGGRKRQNTRQNRERETLR